MKYRVEITLPCALKSIVEVEQPYEKAVYEIVDRILSEIDIYVEEVKT